MLGMGKFVETKTLKITQLYEEAVPARGQSNQGIPALHDSGAAHLISVGL